MSDVRFTPGGVRLRRHGTTPGSLNWLFLPGGPGIGAESLIDLVACTRPPGTSWLVDLPGDGSNTAAPGAPADPYERWPHVLVEAVGAVPNPVAVGHSTGGEYLLATPAIEPLLTGLVLVSTAPHAGWMPVFAEMTRANPIPEVDAAAARHEADPTVATLRDLAVATAPWNFTPGGLAAGARLLAAMPYNPSAVAWSDEHFDHDYVAAWWPEHLPTLIVSGAQDRIVTQRLWDEPRYRGPNAARVVVDDAAHFPWIDRPDEVGQAIRSWAAGVPTDRPAVAQRDPAPG